MSEKVTKFEPANYVEKLRDRMKQSMIDIVPDEQWDAMIRAEFEAFFKERRDPNVYSTPPKMLPSPFRDAVHGVIEEECKTRVRAMLQSEEWTGIWDGSKQVAGQQIKDLVREHGAEIMAKWLESAVAQVVQNIQFSQGQRY